MKRIWLLFILLLAFFLRVWWLDKYPVGFTPDEASFGYDAYSILKTGKDQWGYTLPLVLKSFGDYKAPLYTYLAIPFVAIFGLNKFAVRLPNALLGTAAVYVTYLMAVLLYGHMVDKKKDKSLVSVVALLLAISPWHLMLARGAFEANLASFFMPLGIYFFLKGLKDYKFLIYGAFILGLNLFTYHSARFITPLLVITLVIFYRLELLKIKKDYLIKSGSIFLIFLALTIFTFFLGAGARLAERSIMEGSLESAAPKRLSLIQKGIPESVSRIFFNKYTETSLRFFSNYKTYFSPKFLFKDGPAEATYGMIPGQGVLYWFESVFLVGFILSIFKNKISREFLLIIIWIFLAPIPASLSTGVGYSANRVAIMMPAVQVISAVGAVTLLEYIRKRSDKLLKIAICLYSFIVMLSFAGFLRKYFVDTPAITAKGMLYGNLEVVEWLTENYKDKNILVSRKLSEPHIYIAFAYKIDPRQYQLQTKEWDYRSFGVNWVDQIPEYRLNNFTFKNIEWKKDFGKYDLIIGKPEEFSREIKPSQIFYYPDNSVSIVAITK